MQHPACITAIMTLGAGDYEPWEQLVENTSLACKILRHGTPATLPAAIAAMADGMRQISACYLEPGKTVELIDTCSHLLDVLPLNDINDASDATWMMTHLIKRCGQYQALTNKEPLTNLVTKATQQRRKPVLAALYEQFASSTSPTFWSAKTISLMIPHLTRRDDLLAVRELASRKDKAPCNRRLAELDARERSAS
jgi:hypothetical protein